LIVLRRYLRNSYTQLDLLLTLIKRDLAARYKGSLLGRFWLVLNQLAQLVVYTYAFSIVLRARPPEIQKLPLHENVAYALWLFAGLIPWTAFVAGVLPAATSVLGQPNLVKKVVFPLKLLPLVAIGTAMLESLAGVLILLTVMAFSLTAGHSLPWQALLLPLLWIPQILLMVGLGYICASLTVFIRDIPQTLGIVLNLWFYLTPIAYSVANPDLPQWLPDLVYRINPMAGIVQGYRDFLGLKLTDVPIRWDAIGYSTLIAFVIFGLGYSLYHRLQKGFADLL
jgi:lipopolysaccharide transport system permease protein